MAETKNTNKTNDTSSTRDQTPAPSSSPAGNTLSSKPESSFAGRGETQNAPALTGSTTQPSSSGGTATATARGFYEQAKETAGEAYGVVTEKATTKLEEQKSTLTDGLSTVAQTIRQAGSNLSSPQNKSSLTDSVAGYTDAAAQKLEQAARYFEQRDIRQMVRDVEGYARRNPAVFIGASFAVGLLVARFLKASPSSQNFESAGGRATHTPRQIEDTTRTASGIDRTAPVPRV